MKYEVLYLKMVTRTDNGPGLTPCATRIIDLPGDLRAESDGFVTRVTLRGCPLKVRGFEVIERCQINLSPPPYAYSLPGGVPAPIGGGFSAPRPVEIGRAIIDLSFEEGWDALPPGWPV